MRRRTSPVTSRRRPRQFQLIIKITIRSLLDMITSDQSRCLTRTIHASYGLQNLNTANVMKVALSYVNLGSVHLIVRVIVRRGCPSVVVWAPRSGAEVVRLIDSSRRGHGKQWHCENRRAYACFSRGDATRHLCAISQTDNIACARAAPVTISHFEISARLQRTLFRCAAGRSIYAFSTSGYVKLAARMEAMTSSPIPSSGYNVDSSTDEVVLCLFFVH